MNLSYKDVPKVFLNCQHATCALVDTCLRYQVSLLIPPSVTCITVVNPDFVKKEGKCPYFLSVNKVRYAHGIKHLFDNVPHMKAVRMENNLFDYFGRSTYYRVASGARLISPKEQAYILRLFKKEGIEEAPAFDDYVEKYDW